MRQGRRIGVEKNQALTLKLMRGEEVDTAIVGFVSFAISHHHPHPGAIGRIKWWNAKLRQWLVFGYVEEKVCLKENNVFECLFFSLDKFLHKSTIQTQPSLNQSIGQGHWWGKPRVNSCQNQNHQYNILLSREFKQIRNIANKDKSKLGQKLPFINYSILHLPLILYPPPQAESNCKYPPNINPKCTGESRSSFSIITRRLKNPTMELFKIVATSENTQNKRPT